MGALHCSANQGSNGDVALFFGLSGTGKTTLSADPKRALIGDDEHGWDTNGIFNFEGGCYAKTIDLTQEKEPDIYRAIRRDALLENIVMDDKGNVDFSDGSKTENTRVSYPIQHIDNIVKPVSKGGHANKIIYLTCDAYGVLPPVSKLTKEQAMYQYLSGYTAKVAGTELGITEPTATFSACCPGGSAGTTGQRRWCRHRYDHPSDNENTHFVGNYWNVEQEVLEDLIIFWRLEKIEEIRRLILWLLEMKNVCDRAHPTGTYNRFCDDVYIE